jgi:hypothetical protein
MLPPAAAISRFFALGQLLNFSPPLEKFSPRRCAKQFRQHARAARIAELLAKFCVSAAARHAVCSAVCVPTYARIAGGLPRGTLDLTRCDRQNRF